MTDLMEPRRESPRGSRPELRQPKEPGSSCTNERHGKSWNAWKCGCRCPGAIAAYEAEKQRRKDVRAAGLAAGRCLATRHGGQSAVRCGCVCPDAREQEERRLGSLRDSHQRRTKTLTSTEKAFRQRHRRWCAESTRVSRFNLLLLLSGFVDSPTTAEYVAAMAILARTGRKSGTGLLDSSEIRTRLNLTKAQRNHLMTWQNRARADRHLRRLHRAEEKARRVARAIERGRGR